MIETSPDNEIQRWQVVAQVTKSVFKRFIFAHYRHAIWTLTSRSSIQ